MEGSEISPRRTELALIDVAVDVQHMSCEERDCQEKHPNVNTYSAIIRLIGVQDKTGEIELHTFNEAAMDNASLGPMMQESLAYDEMHLGAQLHKVENFFANESFMREREKYK